MSHHKELPIAVVGAYVVGYVAGRWIAVVWNRGPAVEHGVRRLSAGVVELAHRHPQHQRAA